MRRLFIALVAVTALAACGGGGGGGSSPSPSPSPSPTGAVSYFLQGQAGVVVNAALTAAPGETLNASFANLTVVDPAAPASPVQIEPAGAYAPLFSSFGAADGSSAPTASNVFERSVVYAASGRLRVLDLIKGAGAPAARALSTQVLAEFCVDTLLSDNVYPQPLNPPRDVFAYRVAGGDGSCGSADDERRIVRLDMSATEQPITTPPIVAALYDSAGTAITGWLVRSSDQLQRRDLAFFAPSVILVAGPDLLVLDGPLAFADGQILFRNNGELRAYDAAAGTTSVSLLALQADFAPLVDVGAGARPSLVFRNGNEVRLVRRDTLAVSASLLTLAAGDQIDWFGSDGTFEYFARRTGAGTVFHRMPGTLAGGALETVATEVGAAVAFGWVTPTRLVWETGVGATLVVRSSPSLPGGSPSTLASSSASEQVGIVNVAGENVWLAVDITAGNAPAVRILNSDGSNAPQNIAAAQVVAFGSSAAPPPLTAVGDRMVLAEALPSGAASLGGAVLRAYDAGTRAPVAEYGPLPAVNIVALSGTTFAGRPSLLQAAGVQPSPPLAPLDLFLVTGDRAGLTRVTGNITAPATAPPVQPLAASAAKGSTLQSTPLRASLRSSAQPKHKPLRAQQPPWQRATAR